MMSLFTARLEACDPARDGFRSYRLEAGPDLFGPNPTLTLVANSCGPPRGRRFGRMGTPAKT
jgi:hypothetical protein